MTHLRMRIRSIEEAVDSAQEREWSKKKRKIEHDYGLDILNTVSKSLVLSMMIRQINEHVCQSSSLSLPFKYA